MNEVSTHTAAYISTKKQLGGLTRRENKKNEQCSIQMLISNNFHQT